MITEPSPVLSSEEESQDQSNDDIGIEEQAKAS